MKLLAFDTSSEKLSVAVLDGTKRLYRADEPALVRHSERLLPLIQKAMRSSGWGMDALDAVAVGIGPGSFTGLRIGVITAKTIAWALGKKLIGVTSFEALAREALKKPGESAAILIHARRSQAYAAVYERTKDGFRILRKPGLVDTEVFLKKNGRPFVFSGPEQVFGKKVLFPDASRIAEGALERVRRSQFDDPRKLEPFYLRPKDCNVTR